MLARMEKSAWEILLNELSASPELVAYVEANFQAGDADLIEHLLAEADEKPFSLHHWVEALRVLDHWLDGRGLELPAAEKIGYVSCAAEAATAGAALTHLPLHVEEMLEDYGCERAVEKSSG